MRKEDAGTLIAEELTIEGAFHPDGVNTPKLLKGRALGWWMAKIRLQRALMLVCGVALTLLVFVQVVTRYLLGVSLFGIEELASFVAVYLYFIGAAHGAWERGHISASLVDLILPEGWPQRAVAVFASVVTTLLAGWMTVWAWQYLHFVIMRGTVSLETGIPMFFIIVVIPVCLTLMTVYFAIETAMRLGGDISGGDAK